MRAATRGVRGSTMVMFALAAILLMALPVGAVAQSRDKAAEFQRLVQKAQTEGGVRVIVRLDVPDIRNLTAASVRFDQVDATRAIARARTSADGALRDAIDQTARMVMSDLRGRYRLNDIYPFIPFMALYASAEALAELGASPFVLGIEEDVPVRVIDPVREEVGTKGDTDPSDTFDLVDPQLDGTVGLIGAKAAWAMGYTGSGWTVAVLDTGIRKTHQFFSDKVIVESCYARGSDGKTGAGDCPNGKSTMTGNGSAVHHSKSYTGWDHGTHVSGIAVGDNFGKLAGVAKGAGILAVQVFSKFPASDCGGISKCVKSWSGDQIGGLQRVYALRGQYKFGAVNMSIGGGKQSWYCDLDSRKAAIDNLRAVKIPTVIATGNENYCGFTAEPGCISSAVAVGASTNSDKEASFNNWHAAIQKLFAPGVSIKSSTGGSDKSYGAWNGTSMATPHVTGAFTLLRQRSPAKTVAQLLALLTSTGKTITSSCGTALIPRIQVDKAIK